MRPVHHRWGGGVATRAIGYRARYGNPRDRPQATAGREAAARGARSAGHVTGRTGRTGGTELAGPVGAVLWGGSHLFRAGPCALPFGQAATARARPSVARTIALVLAERLHHEVSVEGRGENEVGDRHASRASPMGWRGCDESDRVSGPYGNPRDRTTGTAGREAAAQRCPISRARHRANRANRRNRASRSSGSRPLGRLSPVPGGSVRAAIRPSRNGESSPLGRANYCARSSGASPP